jgi:hypothetical protein
MDLYDATWETLSRAPAVQGCNFPSWFRCDEGSS